jgi:hypothetical protein
VADVESVSGLQGFQLVARDPRKRAMGDLNFAKADGSMLLMVRFGDTDTFKQWKAQAGLYNAAVGGVGNEAFNGPKGTALYLRKGSHSVSLSSFLNSDTMKPWLSQEQLVSLAKIILSRM